MERERRRYDRERERDTIERERRGRLEREGGREEDVMIEQTRKRATGWGLKAGGGGRGGREGGGISSRENNLNSPYLFPLTASSLLFLSRLPPASTSQLNKL